MDEERTLLNFYCADIINVILDNWNGNYGASVYNSNFAHGTCNCVFGIKMEVPYRHLRNAAVARVNPQVLDCANVIWIVDTAY